MISYALTPRRVFLGLLAATMTLAACQGAPSAPESTATGGRTETAATGRAQPTPGGRTETAPTKSTEPTATERPETTATERTATTATPKGSCVDRVLGAMNDTQRVGQLFMGAAQLPTPPEADLDAMRSYAVGSVFLAGRSTAGVTKTRSLVDGLQKSLGQTAAGQRVGLLVSTDQEGGQVQVLQGPGFSTIPSGKTQGTWSTATLRSRAQGWANELKKAGVNVDLAPVADIVPASIGTANAPIGRYGRQFGSTAGVVSPHVTAFVQGAKAAGVLTTPKHFPGLGSVKGNTDTTASVTDTTLTRTGSNIEPFRAGISAGAGLVMVSLATYQRIDPQHKAVFSSLIVDQTLRHDLGFKGVIISDDLGKAASAQSTPLSRRALSFLRAGGDLTLTVSPKGIPTMAEGIRTAMRQDPKVRTMVANSVRRVLTAKQAAGVLRCPS
ncbi:glycoside hydrolase family 3 N-terminal domain-containing protein [Actinacidiphila sp. bgisy167]|uniref:glycoside hydrolase family 3 N-terminal domain-containing protein n=1 Tax=Actinacidiphila sp. bgisy167 TaxID=3413797 RepID=UPI003D706CB0